MGLIQKSDIRRHKSEVPDSDNDVRCTSNESRSRTPIVADAIAHVLQGDVEAYAVIYRACDGALRAFTSRRYGYLGDDFVDEVAIRTHEYTFSHLDDYNSDKGASFQTWLNWQARGMASRVMREWYGPQFVQYDEAVHEVWAVTATGPADVYEDKRLCRVLREETESLSEDCRESVMLHDKGGLTFDESAEISGLSVMQVRWKRRRALAALKQRLQERGVRPVAVDTTPAPIWYGRDSTDPDDYAAPTVAVLPDGPDTLVGAAAKEDEEEVPTG